MREGGREGGRKKEKKTDAKDKKGEKMIIALGYIIGCNSVTVDLYNYAYLIFHERCALHLVVQQATLCIHHNSFTIHSQFIHSTESYYTTYCMYTSHTPKIRIYIVHFLASIFCAKKAATKKTDTLVTVK